MNLQPSGYEPDELPIAPPRGVMALRSEGIYKLRILYGPTQADNQLSHVQHTIRLSRILLSGTDFHVKAFTLEHFLNVNEHREPFPQ